jgi:hypothetical protein
VWLQRFGAAISAKQPCGINLRRPCSCLHLERERERR